MKRHADKVADTMTIGGLAKAAGVNVETIRYYQRRGLLSEPERPPGGIRRYSAADIDRLTFVKRRSSWALVWMRSVTYFGWKMAPTVKKPVLSQSTS